MTMQDEKRPSQAEHADYRAGLRHHRRKHLALWIAVGGIMALVVTLWALLLPTQFELGRSSVAKDSDRWYALQKEDQKRKSFHEALDDIGERLGEIESEQRMRLRAEQATEPSPAIRGEIDALRTKIEAASKKNELTPRDAANDDIQKQP